MAPVSPLRAQSRRRDREKPDPVQPVLRPDGPGQGGSGGGILIAGHEQPVGAAIPLSAGTGSVLIVKQPDPGQPGRLRRRRRHRPSVGQRPGRTRVPQSGDLEPGGHPQQHDREQRHRALLVVASRCRTRCGCRSSTTRSRTTTARQRPRRHSAPTRMLRCRSRPASFRAQHSLALQGLRLLVGAFLRPDTRNNIIFGNRKQHWEVCVRVLGLVVDGVQDLAVLGDCRRAESRSSTS